MTVTCVVSSGESYIGNGSTDWWVTWVTKCDPLSALHEMQRSFSCIGRLAVLLLTSITMAGRLYSALLTTKKLTSNQSPDGALIKCYIYRYKKKYKWNSDFYSVIQSWRQRRWTKCACVRLAQGRC